MDVKHVKEFPSYLVSESVHRHKTLNGIFVSLECCLISYG